jgi:hypothetical protein
MQTVTEWDIQSFICIIYFNYTINIHRQPTVLWTPCVAVEHYSR